MLGTDIVMLSGKYSIRKYSSFHMYIVCNPLLSIGCLTISVVSLINISRMLYVFTNTCGFSNSMQVSLITNYMKKMTEIWTAVFPLEEEIMTESTTIVEPRVNQVKGWKFCVCSWTSMIYKWQKRTSSSFSMTYCRGS